MAYQVLARKYRPQRFADVAGQDHVTHTLMNALQQGRTAHGYIFSGHRGIGKTTIARILAQALNCRTAIGDPARPTAEPCGVCDSCSEIRAGGSVDVIEIDAATNRGIDEIRELRDAARYSPARDRYKIYILDEAHQITDAAFNALLKTLEEPPDHVVFMMATTEPENIPQTIRSRCQHFSFHAVKFDDILTQLQQVAASEDVSAEETALALLAEAGDGSMRDALSIMDQAIASAPLEDGKSRLSAAQIRELMGSVPNTVFEHMLEAIAANRSADVMVQINELLNAGHSPSSLARQFVRYLRNCLMAKLGGEQTQLLQISSDERARANRTAMLFTEEELTRSLNGMLRTFDELNYRQEQRFHLELGLMKLVLAQRLLPIEELLSGAPVLARPATAPIAARTPQPAISAPVRSSAPAISPFEVDRQRKQTGEQMGNSAPEPVAVAAPRIRMESAESSASAIPPQSTGHLETVTEGSLARAAHPTEKASLDAVREKISELLDKAGQTTAANMMQASVWKEGSTGVVIELPMRPKMIELTFNAAAEKMIREALRTHGLPQKFKLVSNEGLGPAPETTSKTVRGSIQAAALDHPLVQHALKIFRAEVQSVIDLRDSK
jgi:DNA polymerase-3 subunit gamma/tau